MSSHLEPVVDTAELLRYQNDYFTMECNPKEPVVYIELYGYYDETATQHYLDGLYLCFDRIKSDKEVALFHDVAKFKGISMKGRKLVSGASKHPRSKYTVLYGANSLMRTIATILLYATGKGNELKFVKDREEGLKWLYEQYEQ